MIQNCSINLLFPVLQKAQTFVGLPPRNWNALMAFCHITTHEQTRAVHIKNEAEHSLLLPKKKLTETDFLLKRNLLENWYYQAKEQMFLQGHGSSAKVLEEDYAPASGIVTTTGHCLVLWSSPSSLFSICHSHLAYWKSKEVQNTHSGLRG